MITLIDSKSAETYREISKIVFFQTRKWIVFMGILLFSIGSLQIVGIALGKAETLTTTNTAPDDLALLFTRFPFWIMVLLIGAFILLSLYFSWEQVSATFQGAKLYNEKKKGGGQIVYEINEDSISLSTRGETRVVKWHAFNQCKVGKKFVILSPPFPTTSQLWIPLHLFTPESWNQFLTIVKEKRLLVTK